MSQNAIKPFDINLVNRNRNLCIEASAGTGKTYTVQQIVAKLVQDKEPLSLENILIVTYTEKAAGELRDRIRSILKEKNLTEQLALVDNAPIYTIHSFCKQTLSEFSFEANQNDSLELIDESQVREFIEKWIRDELSKNEHFKKYYVLSKGKTINIDAYVEALGKYYLDSNGNEDDRIITLDKNVSENFTADELSKLQDYIGTNRFDVLHLGFLLDFYDRLNNPSISLTSTSQNCNNELQVFLDNLEVLKTELRMYKTINVRKDGIDVCDKLKKEIVDAQNNNESKLFFKTTKKDYPLSSVEYFTDSEKNKGINITADLITCCDYFSQVKNKMSSLAKFSSKVEEYLKKFLFQTQIPEIYKAWNQYKKDNKLQTFDDMIRNVREAVCAKDSKLKKVLQEKYKYAIIDEFQDTNQKQWDIFKNIFMEDKDHAICVVGDPKQSIYAFQGADVNVYSSAVEEITKTDPDNLPQTLDTNYRSTNKVIEFCNEIFSKAENEDGSVANDFFSGNKFQFTSSKSPEKPDLVKPNATYDGLEINPVWIPLLKNNENSNEEPKPGASEYDFAKFAAEQIIDCCKRDKNNKTKLQVYKKIDGKFVLSNVSFSDFAVLCKVKSEMEPIKYEFTLSGIPYNHYKEANLFEGKECRDWIALFNAISVPDFSANNRKILNECLYSHFFDIPLNALADKLYDEPQNPQRIKILKWKKTALERNWALLQEQIYADSKVEERLSQLDTLGSLSKLRQIGDYCVNYLYKTNCSINDLVDHLILLSKEKDESDDENGDLVEKGTDFDAVKIMTIHASKGLEFPVVIAAAGFKESKPDGLYTYHDSSEKYHICCDKDYTPKNEQFKVKEKSDKEANLEFQRLFYVAYTRASSIMMIHWFDDAKYDCLKNSFSYFNKNDDLADKHLRLIPFSPQKYDVKENKNLVAKILNSESKDSETSSQDLQDMENQKEVLKNLAGKVKNLNTYKLSYSTLSHGKKNEEISDEESGNHQRNRSSGKEDDNSEFDTDHIRIPCMFDNYSVTEISKNYPKGNLLGEAVHQTFEEADFNRIGNLSEKDAVTDDKLRGLIRRKFSGQGIFIDETDSRQILEQTCKIVWNTLNAELPEIQGCQKTGRTFSLSNIQDDEHYAELEFNMNPEIAQNKDAMKDYFNGFIDLLFVRKNKSGEKIYSVLDWKTDSMDADEYANQTVIENHTAEKYSIQRVLYSYCLIKWLKQFSNGKDEQWIFENQFGGIYYAYVKGCKAGKGNGIYAQTWKNWESLEKAFYYIVDKKVAKGNY